MNKTGKATQISDFSYALPVDDCVYTISTAQANNLDTLLWQAGRENWEYMPQYVGGQKIVPYGNNNRLPVQIRDLMDENNLAPGILARQKGLLYGEGPFLRSLRFENGEITKEFKDDREIMAWLKDWDYLKYIDAAMTDYLYLKGFFDIKLLERRGRISGQRPRIAALEFVSAKNARLEWAATRRLEDVRHIFVGNFENDCIDTGIQTYPVFDSSNPARYPASAAYNSSYSFARDFYSIPEYWGTLRWIMRGSEVPAIFKYVTDNGFNAAYHVHSPDGYWEKKRTYIRKNNPAWSDKQVEEEIGKLTATMLTKLTEVLSGAKNAGKFFHTVDVFDPLSQQTNIWKVEAIDQKIKDFIESQLKVMEAASSAITSGLGLHASLSNIMVAGKLASGSEMLYAYKLFMMSNTAKPTYDILEPINQAIRFNFPDTDLQLDFYHSKPLTESETSPNDRIKN